MAPIKPETPGEPHGLLDGSIFFGAEADELEAKEDGDKEGTPVVSPEVAKMQGQVDELSKQLDQMRQQNMILMSQPDTKVAPVTIPVPKPEALPDLLENPEEYAKALERQITARVEGRMAATQAQAATEQKANAKYTDLWDDFKTTHKDYSEDFKRVQYAANQVANDLKKQGLDVEKYMFTYRDKFMQDVTREMDSIFGKPGEKAATLEAEAEATRTGGMFGGADNSVKPDAPLAPDNAFSDIRKWQDETGFHR